MFLRLANDADDHFFSTPDPNSEGFLEAAFGDPEASRALRTLNFTLADGTERESILNESTGATLVLTTIREAVDWILSNLPAAHYTGEMKKLKVIIR